MMIKSTLIKVLYSNSNRSTVDKSFSFNQKNRTMNFFYNSLLLLFLFSSMITLAQTYEAENGLLFNGAKVQNCSACSESKQVGDLGGPQFGYFTSLVNVTEAGPYKLNLSFSSDVGCFT